MDPNTVQAFPLLGGLAPVPHDQLPALMARYRLYFHPVRYTSFGMALCEAMLLGLPVVALATTEIPTVIEDGRTGFMHTDPAVLVERMRDLLADPGLARLIGEAGQVVARDRFSIERFGRAWNAVLREAADRAAARPVGRAPFPRRRGTSGAGLSRIPVA